MRAELAAEAADAVFEELGTAAIYSPPSGPSLACIVRELGGDDLVEIESVRVRRDVRLFKVRASDVPVLASGGRFTIGAAAFKIIADPRQEDPERLVWTCEVAPA